MHIEYVKLMLRYIVGLEMEASVVQESKLRIPDPEMKYCIHMLEKHGDNYKVCLY